MARGSLATQRRAYHDEVIDHYENPRNVGKSSGQYRRREGDKKGPCGTVGSLTDGGSAQRGRASLARAKAVGGTGIHCGGIH